MLGLLFGSACCLGLLLSQFVLQMFPAHGLCKASINMDKRKVYQAKQTRTEKQQLESRNKTVQDSQKAKDHRQPQENSKQICSVKQNGKNKHNHFFRTMWQGRLYVRNLPVTMEWWQVQNWVEHIGLPRPSWVHLHKKCGLDVRSAYLHFDVSPDFLQWILEKLNSGHWLSHKQLEALWAEEPATKKACVPWLKRDTMSFHHGICRGQGRTSALDYHGYRWDQNGNCQRRQCPCCEVPWPSCPKCFVSCCSKKDTDYYYLNHIQAHGVTKAKLKWHKHKNFNPSEAEVRDSRFLGCIF